MEWERYTLEIIEVKSGKLRPGDYSETHLKSQNSFLPEKLLQARLHQEMQVSEILPGPKGVHVSIVH